MPARIRLGRQKPRAKHLHAQSLAQLSHLFVNGFILRTLFHHGLRLFAHIQGHSRPREVLDEELELEHDHILDAKQYSQDFVESQ